MAKYFDEDGKEIEAFTKEDVDKMIKEKADADAKAAAEAKAIEDARAAAVNDGKKGTEKSPLDLALEEISSIKSQLHQSRVKEYGTRYAGSDPEKIKQFSESFGRLTGYAEDDAGFDLRAKDAARMAFGTDASVNMGDLTSGGGRNVDAKVGAPATPEDKVLRAALGITDKDVEKFGTVGEAK